VWSRRWAPGCCRGLGRPADIYNLYTHAGDDQKEESEGLFFVAAGQGDAAVEQTRQRHVQPLRGPHRRAARRVRDARPRFSVGCCCCCSASSSSARGHDGRDTAWARSSRSGRCAAAKESPKRRRRVAAGRAARWPTCAGMFGAGRALGWQDWGAGERHCPGNMTREAACRMSVVRAADCSHAHQYRCSSPLACSLGGAVSDTQPASALTTHHLSHMQWSDTRVESRRDCELRVPALPCYR